ncbi:hypothetical protein ACIBQ6_22175 [Nonomuraea sp. NPDC049655]|uniref:hypothetical protein n=1 Tax=Nonomuraea sp. NPDC049655 TaxID=3364355 RepID=UPI0037A5C53E
MSINLRARVSDFVAGMGQAKRSTEDLSRQMVQTGAYADQFRRRLEAATKALPKIEIDADSSPAEIKFAQLRAEMEKLADKKIGIDIDAASAQAQLQEIERELEKLQGQSATIDVKADIGSALAELRAVDAEVSRVNGQDARVEVDADVAGALRGIAMVGAALASLPAVTTLAVGVTALGGAFAAAGAGAAAFGAVAVPALSRINDALKAQESAAKSAGGATGGAGQSAAQAAQQAMQLEQAERRLKDAQNEEKQAQEDLTRAREAGRRALEDMNFSLERSILSQKDAALAVREAEARLAEVQEKHSQGKASDLELERAMLSLEQAQQRSREQEVKTQRARKDTAEANKAGVKGTKQYQDGLDKLAQAQEKVAQAEAQLKQLHLQQQAAMSGGGGGAAKLKDAFADLNKQEIELAKNIKKFKDEYVAWQRSLEPNVFPVIAQGLDLMRLGLNEAGPLAKSASAAFLTLGQDAEKALTGPFWQQFLFNLNTQVPGALTGLGRSFLNVTTGVAGVIDAFLPFAPTVVGGIEKATQAFSVWGQNLKSSPEFHEFIAFVKREAPEVWELIKNVARAIGNIGEAIAPLGVGAFSGLGLLAKLVADMDPEHIQAIALAIGAIKLASLGMSGIAAWQNLAGGIAATGASAGKASGKMAAFGKAAIGVSAAVIGLEATGSAINAISGQSQGIDKLTLALTELGQTGKWAGDLADQWTSALQDSGEAAAGFQDDVKQLLDPGLYDVAIWHPFTELGAVLPGVDSAVDRIEQRFTDLDAALTGMVTSGNLEGANAAFARLQDEARKAGVPVEKLNELFPLYSQAVRVAGNASAEAAAGVDKGKLAMDGFNTSLGAFSSRTDAIQALNGLKAAFAEAEKAIHAANGKLEISSGMTDKQRAAVVAAREQFIGYIDKVKAAADGAQTLSGKTTDGTRAILEQLPQLTALAGKNQEAREQILKLAQAYGISRSDAEKAMGSAKGLRDVLAQLKSKELKITADTTAAQQKLHDLLQMYIKPVEIPVGIKAPSTPPKKKAAGGIQTGAGVDLMAAGGIKPMVANQATFVSGSNTVFAEAGKEAYIPYASQYRDRAIAILAQVANDFGLQLGNQKAAQSLSDLSVTIDASGMQVAGGLQAVMGSLQSTMGQAGSLTSSIGKVGSSAAQLDQSWLSGSQVIGDSIDLLGAGVSDMSSTVAGSVDGLTGSVYELTQTMASIKEGAVGASASKSTGSLKGGSSKAGAVGATATKSMGSLKGGLVEGNQPKKKKAAGGMVSGSQPVTGYASSGPVNASKVSKPQQISGSYGGLGGSYGAGANGAGSASVAPVVNKSVTFNGVTIKETVDADVMWAKADLYTRG